MKRRRLAILVILLIAVVLYCLGVVGTWFSQEPVYEGKRLSVWLQGYDSQYFPAPRLGPAGLKANEVVRAVGPKAVPTLVSMLRRKDSRLKRWCLDWAQYQSLIKYHYVTDEDRNRQAAYAFVQLGAQAQEAVPDLIDIYEHSEGGSQQYCTAMALGYIGPPAQAAAPVLVQGLNSQDATVRFNTAWALGRIQADPALVVPTLTRELNDKSGEVRALAAMSLGTFGPYAKSAVPALTQLLKDSDTNVIARATAALESISPETVTKAVVK